MDIKLINPIIERGVEKEIFKRVAVSVIHGEEIYFAGNSGYGHNAANKFDLASITKSVVYTALWIRYLKGDLSLDDKVKQYIPELSGDFSEEITLIHLMMNSCYFNIRPFESYRNFDSLKNDLFSCGQKFQPGSRVEYTNTPALIAGIVLQRVMDVDDLQTAVGLSIHRDGGLKSSSKFDLRYDHQIDVRLSSDSSLPAGIIHDPLARKILGLDNEYIGVSGMFGSSEGLATFGSYFFSTDMGQKISSEILSNHDSYLGGHSALNAPGFYMWPGSYTGIDWFDKNSFFTYGFTGCLLVICPERKLSISFCSNSRYYPDPKGTRSSDLKNLRLEVIKEIISQL